MTCASPVLGDTPACVSPPPQSETDQFRFIPSQAHEAFAEQIPTGTRIGTVHVRRFRVFNPEDPQESNWLFRWANDFHSLTREWVVRDQLLLQEGDAYNVARVRESERLLRNLKFLFDATVRPSRWCGDTVDLEVITRDIWTFWPTVSFTRSGGANDYSFGFRDTNFLGTGKQVQVRHERDLERSGNTLVYSDPAVFGSRWRVRLALTDNDDGYDRALRLNRPFFSVYEQWSAGAAVEQQLLEENIWFRGDEVAEFDHQRERVQALGGWALHTEEAKQVGRLRFGYIYEEHEFAFSDSDIPPPELPEDRTVSYPFIGYESLEDEFAEVLNFNYLGRTEDLYVGERYHINVGWSDDSLGATRDQLAIDGSYGNTLLITNDRWWVVDAWVNGFWTVDEEEFENLWISAETRYLHRQSDKWAAFGRFRVDYTDGLTIDNQLTLGGDNGLRGYDRNYQTGDRSFVFNLEQRYYSDWHPFRLVRVGLAAFLDVGRAWFDDRDNGSNGGTLANVGIGVRLNSSRAQKSSVVHLDLAFPLVTDDDVDEVQFLIRVRDTF